MSGIRKLLQQVFITRYYRINAGFFLFCFLLFFGLIEPVMTLRFHYGLMQMMAHKILLLLAGCGLLSLYFFKCLLACLHTIREAQHSFLYELQALSSGQLLRRFAYCIAAVYAPALLYAACTAGVAASEHQYAALAIVLLYQLALIAAGALICRRTITRVSLGGKPSRLAQALRRLRPPFVGFYQYLSAYLLQQKKVLLLLLKTGSLLLLQLMVVLNKEALHPEATYTFLLLIITAHALLPYYFVRFTEEQAWLRNLPLKPLSRYGYFAFTYAALFLPELVFLIVHVHTSLSVAAILSLYALPVAMLCAMHTFLYLRSTGAERYTLILFIMLPATMVLLPAVSIWWLSAFWVVSSLILFPLLHRHYEVVME